MELYEDYLAKKAELENAEKWNDLPNGRLYTGSKMDVTLAHSTPLKLQRMGQQVCGGQSYWKSPPSLDSAIMKWIHKNQDTVFSGAIKIMERDAKDALVKCQSFVDELQSKIDESK